MYAVSLILLCLVCFLFYHRLYTCARRFYLASKVPGPRGLPFIGNVLTFIAPQADLWKLMHEMNDDYYPIYKISTPRSISINIRHPDDAEALLTSTRNITKSPLYDFLHPWFQTGLLTSTGRKWHQRRKILVRSFYFNILRDFVSIFDEEGRRIVRDLGDAGETVERDLIPLVTKHTLNTMCETSMGIPPDALIASGTRYRKAVLQMGVYVLHRMVRPWIHSNFIFSLSPTGRKQKEALKTLHTFTTDLIRKRLRYENDPVDASPKVETGSKKRMALIDLLIAANKEGHIDETGMREEVDTFVYEGHETTGMSLAFSLLLLAEYKDCQARAREEIDAVLKESNGRMDMTEIQQFTYLDRCIKESLRLYPSVPFISRSIEEDLQLKKYTIPEGVIVHLHIYDLHRDPHFWPNPHTFDPDRFLPERCVGRHPFAYVPFSAGPRNCIGQKFATLELKALLGHLLHNFYLEPIDLASNVRLLTDIIVRPAHPMRIKFIPRNL